MDEELVKKKIGKKEVDELMPGCRSIKREKQH